MNGPLPPDVTAALAAVGIAIPAGQDALSDLLEAAASRGLACKVDATARTRRRPDAGCPCYRAQVRPDAAGRRAIGGAARGRGENGPTALARALLAWLA